MELPLGPTPTRSTLKTRIETVKTGPITSKSVLLTSKYNTVVASYRIRNNCPSRRNGIQLSHTKPQLLQLKQLLQLLSVIDADRPPHLFICES